MKKKKNLKSESTQGFDDPEDLEDLMNMNRGELAELSKELKAESDTSQAESLARSISKLEPIAQALALKALRREDILLSETVEYLLPRLKRK